jgi:type II secretory pathway pseudopilin PulG
LRVALYQRDKQQQQQQQQQQQELQQQLQQAAAAMYSSGTVPVRQIMRQSEEVQTRAKKSFFVAPLCTVRDLIEIYFVYKFVE